MSLKEEQRPRNSTYKKLAAQWLHEALCFVLSSVVADSFRLRNHQLLVAAKRQAVKKPLFFLFWETQPFLRLIFAVYLRFKKGFFPAAFFRKISKCAPMYITRINVDESKRFLLFIMHYKLQIINGFFMVRQDAQAILWRKSWRLRTN